MPKKPETYVKTIHAQDAEDELTDALTNLLHVHEGNMEAVAECTHEALRKARDLHYPSERDHEEGVFVNVIRPTDDERERYTVTIATDGAWIVLDAGVPTGERFDSEDGALERADTLNAGD